MTLQLEILNRESELQALRNKNSRERIMNVVKFQNKINELINKTPTGELREQLTELNILHLAIMETIV